MAPSSQKMYVIPPKLQDLASWPSQSSTPNAKDMWEISTPPDKSLYWSLFLSYAIASPENSNWLERLLGTQEEMKELMKKKNIPFKKLDAKSIKKQAMGFNPFKNQHSFYHNDEMKKVFRIFTLRLNRTANKGRNSDEWDDDVKLKAAAKMFQCCIQVYETDSDGNKLQPVISAPVVNRVVLYLFKHSDFVKMYKTNSSPGRSSDHKVINVYGFGMSLAHVVPLRRDALGHILKRTDIDHQKIQGIQRDFSGRGNFLASLLGEDWKKETVPSIYASPYVAWKLAAAGFVTDPCTLDENGFSSFYHCMGMDSTVFLHVLYEYASNSFEHSDKTTRNPDPKILKALIEIGRALKNDCSKSRGFSTLGDRKDIALNSYQEILCFNEYQRFVIEEIQGRLSPQASQPNGGDDIDGNRMKRKHIIASLLDCYSKYFYYPDLSKTKDLSGESKYIKFQNFIRHSEYYENLDNYTCLLFFDNFLYLELPADVMNAAVQSLFLTVFAYKLFPKCAHGVHCTRNEQTTDNSSLRVIPFIFRSNFLKSTEIVLQELNRSLQQSASQTPKDQSKKKYDPNSVVRQVTSGLKDLPDIKNEFLIGRLMNYLGIAIDVAVSGADIKGVLTVERALQVIGETLNTTESSNVVGHLLCSCIGPVVEEFFKIRNYVLSHYRPRSLKGKLSLEKEILMFQNIQDSIKEVYSLVKPVYVSQQLRTMDYMLVKGLNGSGDIDATLAKNMESEYRGKVRLLLEIYIRNKSKYKCLANNLLNYIEGEAGNKECHKFRKTGQISALKFLFVFLANQCDEANENQLLLILQDLDRLSKDFESKAYAAKEKDIEISNSESQEITRIITDLRKITDCIFSEVKDEPRNVVDQSALNTFFRDAIDFRWFTDQEMAIIKDKISERLESSRKAKKSLEKFLQNNSQMSELDAQQLVQDIFAAEKDKTNISANLSKNRKFALKILKSVKRDEKDVFEKKKNQDDLDCLIIFSETIEGTHLLLKMNFPNDLHKKMLQFLNRKVEFLLERIGHLKSILIDEDEEILSLWNWGKSEAIKSHTRFLMCQRYMREKVVRASLEMLLFDCMNILVKSDSSLSTLYSKTIDLFTGANLRDVLSHGSTVLETVGNCLDEDDLPSHLIDKMLELIEDAEALQTLAHLWEKKADHPPDGLPEDAGRGGPLPPRSPEVDDEETYHPGRVEGLPVPFPSQVIVWNNLSEDYDFQRIRRHQNETSCESFFF